MHTAARRTVKAVVPRAGCNLTRILSGRWRSTVAMAAPATPTMTQVQHQEDAGEQLEQSMAQISVADRGDSAGVSTMVSSPSVVPEAAMTGTGTGTPLKRIPRHGPLSAAAAAFTPSQVRRPFSTTSPDACDARTPATPITPATSLTPGTPGFRTPGRGRPHRGSPASNLARRPYLESCLRTDEANGYRAAGLLAFRRTAAGVQFLFGREGETASRRNCGRLNLLGGKIDDADGVDARLTAAREFFEESGALLDPPAVLSTRIAEQRHGVMWNSDGKYALHIYELTTDTELSIVESYAAAKSGAIAAGRQLVAEHSEMSGLYWVDASKLLAFLYTQPHRRAYEVCDDEIESVCDARLPVMSFTVCMLNQSCMRRKLAELAGGASATHIGTSDGEAHTTNDDAASSPATAAARLE